MAVDAAQLLAKVGADTSDAESKMQQFSGRLDGMASSFGAALLKNDLIRLATDALLDFGKTAIDSYADNERLGQSLDTLVARELRNKDATLSMSDALAQAAPKAQELLKWNSQLAINSPFTEAGVAQTFRMVEAYGFVSDSADKADVTAKRLTQDIVDFVAGSGRSEETAGRLALALGQIQARGSLAGQEVRQLTEAGIAVDQVLAKAFGKSTTEIVALREQGLIPADAAIKAIVNSMESDFGGSAQRMASGFTGLLNSLSDLQGIASRDILGPAFQAAQPYVQKLVETLQSPEARQEMQELGKAIGTLAGEAIPELIQVGGDAVRMIESIGEAGQPVFQFIKDDGIPVVYGLAAAYTASLIPALVASVPALIAAGAAATAATLPFILVGAAVAGVTKAYNDLQVASETVADKVIAGNAAFQDATKALTDYNAAGETTKALTKDQADQLTRWQAEQRTAIALYAQHTAEYQTFGRASGSTAESLETERQQINLRTEAMQRSSAEIERAIAFQELMANDSGSWQQGIEQTTKATQDQGLVLQQTAEQAAKYQAELTKIGTAGDAAALRLQESQTEFTEAEATRLHDHQDRLTGITDAAERQRLDTKRDYQRQHQAAEQDLADKLADIQRSAADRTAQAAQQESDRRVQAQQQLDTRLEDIHVRQGELTDQFQQQRQDRAQTHQDKLADITRDGAQRAAEADQRALEQRQQAEEQYTERSTALTRQLADVQEQADEQLADRQRARSDQAADRARSLSDRIADIQGQASDRAADAQERYEDDRTNKAEDHQDRLKDLQGRLQEATTASQRQSVQQQIAAENERYAKQEERAKEAFQRAQQHAQEQAARDVARAREAAAREEAKAKEQAAREEAKAAEQLARQQQHITEQQALLDQSYAQQQAKAQQEYERDKVARDAALTQRLADENGAYAHSEALAQRKYDHDLAQLADQTAKEQAAYATREAQASAHYAREQGERDAAVAQQTADALKAYNQQQHDLREHYHQQLDDQAKATALRVAAENTQYAKQEQAARITQARQEADLKLALGKQLDAYVDTQQQMTQINAQEAGRRRAIIAAEYGADPAAEQARFGALLAGIFGSQSQGGGGDVGFTGGNGPLVGTAQITIVDSRDPAATAQEVRKELIKSGQRNTGLRGGLFGGYGDGAP